MALVMSLVGALMTGIADATWKVGVLTLLVVIALSEGALSCGVCGVNSCCVRSGGCSGGACTCVSLATRSPPEAAKSGVSVACL